MWMRRSTDIQVLTPMRKGSLGVETPERDAAEISRIRHLLRRNEKETARGLFREGDKVMQIKNNYQIEWESKEPLWNRHRQRNGYFQWRYGNRAADRPCWQRPMEVLFDDYRTVDLQLSDAGRAGACLCGHDP